MTMLVDPPRLGTAATSARWTRQVEPQRFLYEVSAPSYSSSQLVVSFAPSFSPAKQEMMAATRDRLNELLRLQEGWDGLGAPPVAQVAAMTAIQWLNNLSDDETVSPQIFPLVNGGVQMEWLVNGDSLEVEVSPTGEIGVLGMDAAGNVLVEGDYPDPNGLSDFVGTARKHLHALSDAVRSVRPPW